MTHHSNVHVQDYDEQERTETEHTLTECAIKKQEANRRPKTKSIVTEPSASEHRLSNLAPEMRERRGLRAWNELNNLHNNDRHGDHARENYISGPN